MPFAAALPLIIGAGVGAAGLIRGRGGSNSSTDPNNTAQQQALVDIQKQLADYGIPAGKESFAKATGAYDTSLDFYNKLLGGSNEDILKLINADEFTKSADEAQATAYGLAG